MTPDLEERENNTKTKPLSIEEAVKLLDTPCYVRDYNGLFYVVLATIVLASGFLLLSLK